MDKRTFVKSVLLGVAGVYASGLVAKAVKTRKKWDGVFRMPELPYSPDLLEPFADAETIKLHLQHHAAYTNRLNAAVNASGLTGKTAHELMRMSSEYPDEIRNLAGGYINHKLFWRVLTPMGKSASGEFTSLIKRDFGSLNEFRKKFSDAARPFFGSGWVWLISDTNGKLKITSTGNHDNPVMDIVDERGFPVLCLDIWDHAFSEKNKKPLTEYIEAFWNVVNWEVVEKRYSAAAKINFRV